MAICKIILWIQNCITCYSPVLVSQCFLVWTAAHIHALHDISSTWNSSRKGLSQLQGSSCETEAVFVSAVDKNSCVCVRTAVGRPSAVCTLCRVCLSPSGSLWCRVHLRRTSCVATSWGIWPSSWNKPPRTSSVTTLLSYFYFVCHWLIWTTQLDFCNALLLLFSVSLLSRFLPALLTAVLTNHLGWVPTVMPNGQPPMKIFLEKHSSQSVDMLAKTHPYNPLWAQLGKWCMK